MLGDLPQVLVSLLHQLRFFLLDLTDVLTQLFHLFGELIVLYRRLVSKCEILSFIDYLAAVGLNFLMQLMLLLLEVVLLLLH